MSSHCSWQTPLDSNLFPCHGLSGKRSRSSKIMSAAVLEAVSLISKQPCPGISTETDMRQRMLCAVQRHELIAVFLHQHTVDEHILVQTWHVAVLFSMCCLSGLGFISKWVAQQNANTSVLRKGHQRCKMTKPYQTNNSKTMKSVNINVTTTTTWENPSKGKPLLNGYNTLHLQISYKYIYIYIIYICVYYTYYIYMVPPYR